MLPNFLIIGAARSGTTALYYGLREHPQVFMPAKKELNFFTSNWKHGLEWYGDFFQSQTGQPAIIHVRLGALELFFGHCRSLVSSKGLV
jgi:hypothetical protein